MIIFIFIFRVYRHLLLIFLEKLPIEEGFGNPMLNMNT
jgi:hypothetical protein